MQSINEITLKCLLINKGLTVDPEVYSRFESSSRLSRNPLECSSLILPGGINVQIVDTGTHSSPFSLKVVNGRPAILHNGEHVCFVSFNRKTEFYSQKTSSGLPFAGNAVLQGSDFVSFQCLWHCEYAEVGKPCRFCFSGAYFDEQARQKRQMPAAVPAADLAEIVRYAVVHDNVNSVQITGGSTFLGEKEHRHIVAYLNAIAGCGVELTGEILLYITPPDNHEYIDEYFALGASRIACSIEVWDRERAKLFTPGKMFFTTRKRHLDILTYIAAKYGKNRAFCNFVIGLESFDTLSEGATWLAERGVIPSASVLIPSQQTVEDVETAPDAEYFQRVTDMLSGLYRRYALCPAGGCGLNVCIEKDIYNTIK